MMGLSRARAKINRGKVGDTTVCNIDKAGNAAGRLIRILLLDFLFVIAAIIVR
jgi:hypothetical protein